MRQNLGQQPNSDMLRSMIANEISCYFNLGFYDYVIVHHYTDKENGLQVEYEIQFEEDEDGDSTIKFGRVLLK